MVNSKTHQKLIKFAYTKMKTEFITGCYVAKLLIGSNPNVNQNHIYAVASSAKGHNCPHILPISQRALH
jgi:hypothetical protein